MEDKKFKKVNSPEQLNQYIRLSNPGVWILLLAAFIALVRSIMVAIKLVDIYEMGETPKVASSSSTSSIAKAKEDSKIGACCVCIIFIFIIFAFVAIL